MIDADHPDPFIRAAFARGPILISAYGRVDEAGEYSDLVARYALPDGTVRTTVTPRVERWDPEACEYVPVAAAGEEEAR